MSQMAPEHLTIDTSYGRDECIYGHEYGIVAIDEASKLRNLSKGWSALSEALRRGVCPIAMTATPVHNGPMVSCFLVYRIGY